MDPATIKILDDFASILVPEIKSVSKRFADTIDYEIIDHGFSVTMNILASPHIMVLVDGRPPTRTNYEPANPNLQKIILKWIKDKGITPKPDARGKIPSLESLSFVISRSIHNYGDRLYQAGGGNNIFDEIINRNRLNAFFSLVEDVQFKMVESIIINRQK